MKAIFWHRRDLRTNDNTGLYHALRSGLQVVPIFIFDRDILKKLEDQDDGRVTFIHDQITGLKEEYQQYGSDLKVYYGYVTDVWKQIVSEFSPEKVFTNHDYEPYAINRDEDVRSVLEASQIQFESYKDQVIYEKDEVLKDDGTPYTVYTPYSKKWKARFKSSDLEEKDPGPWIKNLAKIKGAESISLDSMGFVRSDLEFPNEKINRTLIKDYHKNRDIPSLNATSRLSVHLRFGTVSIRAIVRKAFELNETWLNELIWREFFMMILYHFPHVVNGPFKKKYERIKWRNDEAEYKTWCEGNTGYPIVDAGMRELNYTGFMHNRLRMIVASFLTKHLLIDWRWGEAYFARKLLDFELSSNNGGWQWAAGTGCDAAPYFRIFNPYTQTKKFDKDLTYIRKWVPEFDDPFEYPNPIVDHKQARERALEAYKTALA